MALVRVMLCVERINFMRSKMQSAGEKIQFFLEILGMQRMSCHFLLVVV